MFEVEEAGEMVESEDPLALEKFVNYIKIRKMVLLEDLSAEFKLTTQ